MAVEITLFLFLFVLLSNVRVKILVLRLCLSKYLDSMTGTSNFLMKRCQHGSVDVSQSEVGAVKSVAVNCVAVNCVCFLVLQFRLFISLWITLVISEFIRSEI